MDTLQRIQEWAVQGISIDVTTMILRSEGVPDFEICAAYNTIASMDDYETIVDRGMGTIVRRS